MQNVSFGAETQKTLQKGKNDTQAKPQVKKVSLELEEDVLDIKKELRAAKRQNGLIEKIADKIKSVTGYGLSVKKLEKSVNSGENQKQVSKDIQKYRAQQESTAQATADVATGLLALGTFFKWKNGLEKSIAKNFKLDGGMMDAITDFSDKGVKMKNMLKGKYAPLIIAGIGATFVGGISKWLLMKMNRIGTQQYKADLQDGMKTSERNREKRETAENRNSANTRNFLSGMINGATTPLMALGGIIGVPVYIVVNSLNRYFVASKEQEDKSIGGYVENIANSPISQLAVAGTIAATSYKKANFTADLTKNLNEVITKLKRANLNDIPVDKKPVVDDLHDIVFENSRIQNIIDQNDSIEKTIQNLSDENIFALKFKQILSNDDDLASALKTDCPFTRCVKNEDGTYDFTRAQEFINKAFGEGKYKVTHPLGAGTIAETYLVKDATGKEYCIKLLKEGITSEKIEADSKKIINMINGTDKTEAEKSYLIKNFENIAEGVKKEIDFNSELQAAQELAKTTTKAKVVIPKEVSKAGDCYVMERAEGVCMQKLLEYAAAKSQLASDGASADIGFNLGTLTSILRELRKNGTKPQEIVDNFEKIYGKEIRYNLTGNELKNILQKYQEIYVEQFAKIGTEGKTIHGDLHPGNIFIDINAYRAGKEDYITLIDTGNVIRQSKDSAFKLLNMSNYIKNGDTEGISRYLLEGAKLPEGMDETKAFELVNNELKDIFFGMKYYTGNITNDNIMDIVGTIMRKNGIVPATTNASLKKAQQSAELSMEQFMKTYKEIIQNRPGAGAKEYAMSFFDTQRLNANRRRAVKMQEEANLASLPKKIRKQFERTASCPSESSKEYLIYAMKKAKQDSRINE